MWKHYGAEQACGEDQSPPPGAVVIRTGLGERLNGGSGASPLRLHVALPALHLWTTASLKRRQGLGQTADWGERTPLHITLSTAKLERAEPGLLVVGGPQSGPLGWAPSLGP